MFGTQLLYENTIQLFRVKPSLSTSIGTLTLERPTILASGILGISLDVFERLYRAGAGAVVTKSLSKEPWDGYANPTIFSVKGGGWLNAVGLSNPGAPNFAKTISSNKDVPIIVSLVGSVEDDFDFMVKQFENCKVSAYELNLSCPHVAKVGLEVGDDVDLVKKIIKKVKNTNFSPRPKVDSVILRITQNNTVSEELIETINKIFSYRRKTIQNIGKNFDITIKSDKRLEDMENNEIIKLAEKIKRI